MNQQAFCDRHGNEHRMVPGHRQSARIKSLTGYSNPTSAQSSDKDILDHLRAVIGRVRLGATMLGLFGPGVSAVRVLNLGASGGEEAVCLAGLGAAEVVGTDYGSHFTPACDAGDNGNVTGSALAHQQNRIVEVFSRHADELGFSAQRASDAIRFLEDDITSSTLATGSFDTICSWATLEHLLDPAAAFREMHRLLVPGGLAYHEYNPFFCMDGGHTLGTLDFPWGHVRLDANDYARYVGDSRPHEMRECLAFYETGLNRMMISEVEQHARSAGFELLALVPRARTEDLLQLTRTAFEQARRNYPGITVNDLVCRIVRLVLRRPG